MGKIINKVSRRAFLTKSAAVATGVAASGMAVAAPMGFMGQKAGDLSLADDVKNKLLAASYKSPKGRDVTTDAVRAGDDSGCASYPIYQGTTNLAEYTRDSNPTIDSAEVKIATLEGAEYGVASACGMAAISQTLLRFLHKGMRLVHHRCIYSGTLGFIDDVMKPNGVDCDSINMTDLSQLKKALKKKTDVVYFEIVSNPPKDVIDVVEATKLAHEHGAMVIIDNTFLTPYLIQPLTLGVDVVIHSATKYMMGHGNGLAGITLGSKELLEPLKRIRKHVGGVMAPFNAFLLHQGLKTLPIRMERHCANAMKVAEFLDRHPKVKKVHYPGLKSNAGYEVARKQMKGFGAMLGFELEKNVDLDVKVIQKWVSLGDVQTLLCPFGDHADERTGIPKNYYRMSIGIEDADDIINDLNQAFRKI